MHHLSRLLLALGFLTRLGPARRAEPGELAATLPWFPVVGLVVGVLMALPWRLGLLAGQPLVQAWLAALVGVYLTRGLHWDGWCDLWDAWGSGARDDEFWRVIKDSRAGAFGVMGLVLGLGGQIALLAQVLGAGALGVAAWACVLGRTCAVLLAWSGRSLARPGLGQAFLQGATTGRALTALAVCLLLGLYLAPLRVLLAAGLLCFGGLACLDRLARSRGGLNGDFLGAAVVMGELAAYLGLLAVS